MADADATELQGDGKALGGNARKRKTEDKKAEHGVSRHWERRRLAGIF